MFIHEMVVGIGVVSSAGASVASLLSGMNYSVLFGAFAGAVFYVAGAADIGLRVRAAYFVVSWIVGVFGADVVGSKLAGLLGYTDRPLDGLGAVILSALAIKTLTFFSQQDPAAWLARIRGGFHGNK